MSGQPFRLTRREFLVGASAAGAELACAAGRSSKQGEPDPAADANKALIAITLDLEMARHYPTWDVTHWDYEKGNLNEPAKQYTVEACRRVKAAGGVLQCFVLGRVFEQENVDWLKEIVREGHPVGNHTYDHVHVWAAKPEQLQARFQRAPWLIHGKTPREVIVENIRLTDMAMKTRIGVSPVGFRTPGGAPAGLIGREDLQEMLLQCGFRWVSSMARSVAVKPENPTEEDFRRVVEAQNDSQPFVYPSGLIEIPMSPLGDVASFRRKDEKWKLGDFLKMVERAVRWAIERRAVFDLLGHPSIMYVEDPQFRTYELVCGLVKQAADRAQIVGLDAIARRVELHRREQGAGAAEE
jgi:peptidoglycan/xylan/chitin deacetylase (PgdA/CDA1 family)